jgi:hypothetical protein
MDISEICTISRYMAQMIKEAIEVKLHLNNMNKEDGLCLSQSWNPLIHSLKGCRNSWHRRKCPDCPNNKNRPLLVLSVPCPPT